MIAAQLVTSLAEEIRAVTANLKLPVEYQNEDERTAETTWRRVNVYEQYIPADLFQTENYFPCVVVEWLETHDTLRGDEIKSVATVGLSFGVFAKEADGWKDCFHLMELVRQRVLSVRTLARRFRLIGDEVTWQIGQNQPAPFFFGYSELAYEIFQTQEPFPVGRTVTSDLIDTEPTKVLKVDAFNRRIK